MRQESREKTFLFNKVDLTKMMKLNKLALTR